MMHGIVFAKQDARSMWLKLFLLNLVKASLPMFPVTMLPAKEKTLSDVTDEGNVSVIL